LLLKQALLVEPEMVYKKQGILKGEVEGHQYSDTSPFSIPCTKSLAINLREGGASS